MKLLDLFNDKIIIIDNDVDFDKYIFDLSFRYCQYEGSFSKDKRSGIGIEIRDGDKYKLVAYINLSNVNILQLEDMYKSIKHTYFTGITVQDLEKQENNKNVLLDTINIHYRRILDRRPDLWIEVEEQIYPENGLDYSIEKFVYKGYEDLKRNWVSKSKKRMLDAEKVYKYIEQLQNKIKILEGKQV